MLAAAISVTACLMAAPYLARSVFQSLLAGGPSSTTRSPLAPGLVGVRSGPRVDVVVAARDEEG